MATTSTPAAPPVKVTVALKISETFIAFGHELEVIGVDALKDIGIAQQDVSLYGPEVLATIQTLLGSKATINQGKLTGIINESLNTAKAVATALQDEGLNPSADQVAAVQVAVIMHTVSSAAKSA